MNKLGKRILVSVLAGTMIIGSTGNVFAATTSNEITDRELAHMELSKEAATQGMVLLENKNQALPIAKSGNIAVWGGGAYATIKGGTGSGNVNQRQTVNVYDGFKNAGYNVTTSAWLDNYAAANGTNIGRDAELTEADIEAGKAGGTDTAIYVITRQSGEFRDRAMSDFNLTEVETANIRKMAENFENSIVVLNVGGMMDTSFMREIDDLDSLLLMSQAGMEGGNAVIEVLNGHVTPSGKLTDSWALQYSDYPASASFANNDGDAMQEDYEEGIYVGYRYFDTFGLDVAYEFGYGDSYTDFDIQVNDVTANADQVSVDVTVTNTGDTYSGKEVVQVYFSAPDGTLEKPYQELAAYAKTDSLEPGASQELTINYATTEMSSYDETRAAYIMEAGDYLVRVGNSSRNTEVAAVLDLNKLAVTEQLSNQYEADKEIEELSKAGATPIAYEGEADEIANAKVINLSASSLRMHDGNNASAYDDETITTYVPEGTDQSTLPVSGRADEYSQVVEEVPAAEGAKLIDVYNGDVSMESFVASLTYEQLGNITNGASSTTVSGPVIGAQANSVRGAAGETTGLYFDSHGIPNIVLADGPAGVRITREYTQNEITYYQFCTAWPIGTLLAQSWDVDLVETVTKAIGKEMEEFGVTLWLAPGMNIHRDPLCGRNFEYYSEDPLISGTMAAASTKGIQSTPGIGVTIKHYAANNQETNRNSQNDTISERALREIYLKGFEIAVKAAQPMAIMTSYNKINSEWAAGSYDLCTDITRGEWGFKGLIMTDWGAAAPKYESMHAGNDLIMPGNSGSVVAATLQRVDPEFDTDGYVKNVRQGWSSVEAWNDLKLQAGGEISISTTVEAGVALDTKVANKVSDGTAIVTVTETGEVLEDLSDTSAARTVTYTGYYDDSTKLYLGDVQKSVINILNVIMETTQFKKMNSEVDLISYTDKYQDILKNYVDSSKEEVQRTSPNTALNSWIAFMESLNEADYQKDGWDALEAAVDAAKAVAENPAATQAEIDGACAALLEAFGNLEYGVQKQHLITAVKAAEDVLAAASDYDAADVQALEAAVDAAKAVLENADADQAAVNTVAEAVMDALAKMDINADLAMLESLVASAEAMVSNKYTADSLEALEEAIANAKAVLADANRGESDVSLAYKQLTKAITGLQMKGNKAALSAVLDKAEEILANSANYVVSSIQGLADAIADAKEVYNNDNATQAEVNKATEELTNAVVKARLKGDVNGDNVVDTNDSAILLKFNAELSDLAEDQLEGADVNGDGTADTNDVVLILQYASEKISSF